MTNKTDTPNGKRPAFSRGSALRVLVRFWICALALVVFAAGFGSFTAQADTVGAQQLVFQLQNARVNRLILNQPDLAVFLSRAGTRALNADITDKRGTVTFSSGVDGRLWSRLTGRWGQTDSLKDRYGFAVMGLHTYIRPNLIVGAMVEADYLSQDATATDKEGSGAMAGTYFLARTVNHPLFFEGRFLYGRANNDVQLSDTSTEQLDTRRALAQLKLSGQLRYGALTVVPSVWASYATDALVPRAGQALTGQGIRLRQIKTGLNFSRKLRDMNGGPLTLTGGGTYTGSSTRRYGVEAWTVPKQRTGRGRVDLGVSYLTQAGGAVVINSFADGLGAANTENYGVKAGFKIRF